MKKLDGIKYWMEMAVNAAIIAAVALIGVTYFQSRPAPVTVGAAIKAGDTIKAFAPYAAKDKTLVAVMSTACVHCRNSMPMMAELNERLQAKGSEVAVILQKTTPITANQFLGAASSVRYVSGITTADFRIRGTPTFAVLDRKGKVLKLWTGELTTDVPPLPGRTPVQEIERSM